MPARTTDPVSRGAGARWVVNTNGQFVDADAENAAWGLADEIGRLKLGDVTVDNDDSHVPLRTPPKNIHASAAVAQIADSSPLDSSSSVASSPHAPPHHISHSRGSSADSSLSTRESVNGAPLLQLKNQPAESKERPHSFSGGLSTADLRRLEHVGDGEQQWTEQPSFPSLAHRPLGQQYGYNGQEQIEYGAPQQRSFASAPRPGPQFVQPRGVYRQQPQPRSFVAQTPPSTVGYGGHTSHLSLGNTQQLYEMMLPPHDNHHPAVTRVQQQHNIFRPTHHHHSASDPSAIRDAATLSLLTNNMQSFAAPNMFQPGIPPSIPIYPAQYYGPQEIAVQQAMVAARLQAQYTGPYGVPAPATATPTLPLDGSLASPTSSTGQVGPSANNRKLGLYKTELCRSWEEKGTCRYGAKCQFAHGEDELRKVSRHPKYKTEICKTFWVSGSCPYGKRCCFIHTELSSVATPATAGTAENTPPQPPAPPRERSNSDPDTSSSVSLLTRIQRQQESSSSSGGVATPIEPPVTNGFPFTRPPTGSLRVDTTVVEPSVKQNKSAYPSFASNGILLPATEHITAKSPAPVTAGPDLGRHNLARMEIVGYPNHQKKNSSSSNPRNSISGSDVDLSFSPSPPTTGHSYGLNSNGENATPARVNGHVRAGSAGNWGTFSRSSHLSTSTTSAYPRGSSPAGEIMSSNSPWSSTELAVGSSRLHEKTWS